MTSSKTRFNLHCPIGILLRFFSQFLQYLFCTFQTVDFRLYSILRQFYTQQKVALSSLPQHLTKPTKHTNSCIFAFLIKAMLTSFSTVAVLLCVSSKLSVTSKQVGVLSAYISCKCLLKHQRNCYLNKQMYLPSYILRLMNR